jgi:hypothetical protein
MSRHQYPSLSPSMAAMFHEQKRTVGRYRMSDHFQSHVLCSLYPGATPVCAFFVRFALFVSETSVFETLG